MTNTTRAQRSGKSKGTKPLFRNTQNGVIPNSVNDFASLALDATTKVALTSARARLVIELDAGGTRVSLVDSRTNDIIGSPDDLQKLGNVRTFLSRERKEAASKETARVITQTAFLAEKLVQEKIDERFEMKPVDNSYGASLRPYYDALKQKFENEKLLEANVSTEERSVYLKEIQKYFVGIGRAYSRVISSLSRGENIKGKLNEFLFDEFVPEWVAKKFVSKAFRLERSENLSKVFFPTDPLKGLSLSVREWRDAHFLYHQRVVLDRSTLIHTLINDDEFIRSITKIDRSIRIEANSENPLVRTLMGAKAVAMPRVHNADRVIELGSKSKSGFKYPTPGMESIVNSITALSTAVLRIYSANLQSVDLVADYYNHIVPDAVTLQDISPTNNLYVQWGNATNKSVVWLDAIQGGLRYAGTRISVWRWLCTELKLSEIASGQVLARTLKLNDSGKVSSSYIDTETGAIRPGTPGAPLRITRITSLIDETDYALSDDDGKSLTRPLSEVEKPLWNDFQKRVFPPVKKGKDSANVQNLSVLTSEGKALVRAFEAISPHMTPRIKSWLRSFSDERLQQAAVKTANAVFDEIFSASLMSEEESSDEEDSDEE